MVDAHVSGACVYNVQVRVLFWAQNLFKVSKDT